MPDIIMAYNPKYSFHLRKVEQTWMLSKLQLDGRDTQLEQELMSRDHIKAVLITPHTQQLTDLVALSSFQVMSARPIDHGGEQLVEIKFANKRSIDDKPFSRLESGILMLDPNRYWCLRGGEVLARYGTAKTPVNMRVQIRVDIEGELGNRPIPKRYEELQTVTVAGGPAGPEDRRVWEFDMRAQNALPSSDTFRLSAFGLPEPPGIEWERRTPWWLWLIGSAFALLLVAAGFTWLKRRAMRSRAAAA
jgi:hypothetical protein